MSSSAFHPDELAAQARAGITALRSGIRDFMPEQHRSFFAALPYLLVGTIDRSGWPLAALLQGDPGFASSPDPATLRIDALPAVGDPAAGMIRVGEEIGTLGIDLGTRRRNRANGVVSRLDAGGFTVTVRQSFGNCPQYIQRRAIRRVESVAGQVRELTALESASGLTAELPAPS